MQKMKSILTTVVLMAFTLTVSAAPILAQSSPAGGSEFNFSRMMGRVVGAIVIIVIVLKLAGVGKKKE
ncbi:MAG: hypothetical protein ACI9VS_000067 [Candidatus Binatia bacterium]|jgi:hypothetical protein